MVLCEWPIKTFPFAESNTRMKRAVLKLCLIVSMVLLAATRVAAKDWRSILPMHSTRADVEAQWSRDRVHKEAT